MGDIHGQLADLVHLMNHNGLPSPTNKYVFNGDFVDRGFQGVEVRTCVIGLVFLTYGALAAMCVVFVGVTQVVM